MCALSFSAANIEHVLSFQVKTNMDFEIVSREECEVCKIKNLQIEVILILFVIGLW